MCILFIIIFFFTFLLSPVFASVTGIVTDTKGSLVSGAKVTFIDESNPDNRFSDDTNDQGYYEIDITVLTRVEESKPSEFTLGQNYPNPFNPTTTIPFNLDKSDNVQLDIYNIMGQHIKTLIDGYYNAGSHSVVWDARDESGNHVSAGVYLYKLRSGTSVKTNKMLLLDGGSGNVSNMIVTAPSPNNIEILAVKATSASWKVEITGDGIETYTESGLVLIDGHIYNFVVSRLSIIYNNIIFVSIPAGTFRMGDVENYGQWDFEKPVHPVTLSSFEMSIYEITQGQYQMVMGYNPVLTKTYGMGDNYPVYYVSWFDAVKFCNKLSDATGFERCYNDSTLECDFSKSGFRLPTEAEWEYACRAGTETYFYTGNTISGDGLTSTDLERAGWYWDNWGQTNNKTHVVGEKESNSFGLYDMHGNVWEWCNDWWGPYSSDSVNNPTGPITGSYRVIRGGAYGSYAKNCRSAAHALFNPSEISNSHGYRVVRRP